MINWAKPEIYEEEPDVLKADLAGGLIAGELIMMLGAGISKEFNLPTWAELVKNCCMEAMALNRNGSADIQCDSITDSSATSALLDQMLLVRKACGEASVFHRLVSRHLYSKWAGTFDLVNSPRTMRALAVLMMGSRRGRINLAINYNFDSLLEWYLAQHGYVVGVVEDLPKTIPEADVTIYHPHGYLPFNSKYGHGSSNVVFDSQMMAQPSDRWKDFYRHILSTKLFIAVGLSGEDPAVRATLLEARTIAADTRRTQGVWICKKNALSAPTKVLLREAKVAIVEFDEHSDAANYLVEVAQHAAGEVII